MIKKRGKSSVTNKKENKRNNKRGQEIFGLSFGMIFAIILIIFFIVVAFIAIKAFLGSKDCAQVGIFISNLQDDVDTAWRANDQTVPFKAFLPTGIKKVCFSNVTNSFKGSDKDLGVEINFDPDKNMFLIPLNKGCDMSENKVNYIDINYITSSKNPYCIDVVNGKVEMMIEKGPKDRLVKIRK